jgi:hypothetical protein
MGFLVVLGGGLSSVAREPYTESKVGVAERVSRHIYS